MGRDLEAGARTHTRDQRVAAWLVDTAQRYRSAARRLAPMRGLAAGSEETAGVDELIATLRETHRRRPRLQHEFDWAGLH